MKLLEIQSSVRREGSSSRRLSQEFIQLWQGIQTAPQCKQRDVGFNPPAYPTALWTTANYLPPEERSVEMTKALAESEDLIEELLWADRLLLGVPMYNFGVPSPGGGQVTAAQRPLHGCHKVARFLLALRRSPLILPFSLHLVQINNQPGILTVAENVPQSTLSFEFSDAGVRSIFAVVNPDKLKAITL